jgi:alpha-tubulin suppressor-like RCC1 family protein
MLRRAWIGLVGSVILLVAATVTVGPVSATARQTVRAAPADDLVNQAGNTSDYHALSPARIVDTRSGVGANGPVGPGQSIDVKVTGVGGVPSTGVAAVVVNVTATDPTQPTYITVWPTGEPRPIASNLDVTAGESVPNLVVATVGANGTISLYNFAGTVDLIVDVTGWFPTGGDYHALTPARFLDTRTGRGGSGPVGPDRSIDVKVTGAGNVPSSGVGAVVVNVTATNPTAASYITVWPAGSPRPTASNLNVVAAQSVPNLVVATVGANGSISLYNLAGTVDLIVDVTGWFPTGSDYHALTPARILDTRNGVGGSGPVAPEGSIEVKVTGVGGVPDSGVAAVVVNVTATNPTRATYITAWPTGEPRPTASNLNVVAGDSVANLVVATVGANGTISLYNFAGTVDLIVDVTGWFAAATTAPTLVISPSSLPEARTDQPYHAAFTATGGTGPYTWTVTGLPAGLAAFADGTIAGTTTWAGRFPLTVTAVDSNGLTGTIGVNVTSRHTQTIATGRAHTCALLADGTAKCWGYNAGGALGNSNGRFSLTPAPVVGLTNAIEITAGPIDKDYAVSAAHTCSLIADGTVKCWGDNTLGQLGNGQVSAIGASNPIPLTVPGLVDVVSVAAGGYHTCALIADGTVKCWGRNDVGQIGDAHDPTPTPTPVGGVSDAVAIAAGAEHSCALLKDGTAKCWGDWDGQLGGGALYRPAATTVPGLAGAASISAGYDHTCAIVAGGSVECWGANNSGQLGAGGPPISFSAYSPSPIPIKGLVDIVAVAAGAQFSCAVDSHGFTNCWGRNTDAANAFSSGNCSTCPPPRGGQLGNGTIVSSTTPVGVIGSSGEALAGAVAIAASGMDVGSPIGFACARTADGNTACWGSNSAGQLGNGTQTDSTTFVSVSLT